MGTKIKLEEEETYISPGIKIMDIETEQSLLANGSLPDMPGEDR